MEKTSMKKEDFQKLVDSMDNDKEINLLVFDGDDNWCCTGIELNQYDSCQDLEVILAPGYEVHMPKKPSETAEEATEDIAQCEEETFEQSLRFPFMVKEQKDLETLAIFNNHVASFIEKDRWETLIDDNVILYVNEMDVPLNSLRNDLLSRQNWNLEDVQIVHDDTIKSYLFISRDSAQVVEVLTVC